LIHKFLLSVLSMKLASIKVLHGVELEAPHGSKNVESDHAGWVDLTLFRPDFRKPGRHLGHLYDLKPDNPKRYRKYQTEVDLYLEYFPDTIPGGKVSPPQASPILLSAAQMGTDLTILARVAPQIFEPVRISDPTMEVTMTMSLPVDENNHPVEGLVVYKLDVRMKRPGEEDSVQRTVDLLKTRPYQTHGAQIRMELQLGAAQRIAFNAAFAAGFAAPFVLGIGGTAAGTGATAAGGGATVIQLAPAAVESITKAAAAILLGLRGLELAQPRK
jgi:hypothetical protein